MFKLNLQLFAQGGADLGSAVVGHRTFMSTSKVFPQDLVNDVVLGVRSTPDLGSAQNTVEANTLDSIRVQQVAGLYPATDIEYTYLFNKELVEKQLGFVNKETWVYEERENKTSKPTELGCGIVYKVKLGGLTTTGQSPEGLQEMTQSATLLSEEFFFVVPTYGEGLDPTYKIVGLQTGVEYKLNEDGTDIVLK